MTIKQCGKVIEYDFAPKPTVGLMAQMTGDELYRDDRVLVMRFTFTFGGKPFGVMHFMGDLTTGAVTHL